MEINHLDGRSTAPVRARHAHAARFHDGPMGGRRAGARTTHMKVGFIRSSVPLSDQATIDWRFFHHGDLLSSSWWPVIPSTPVEPEIISKSFRLSKNPVDVRDPCVPGYEGRDPAMACPTSRQTRTRSSHEFMELYNLAREAVLGYQARCIRRTRQANQEQLRATAAVHRRLRCRRQLRPRARPPQ